MVAARRDFEDFLIEHGFSPERALYWASALERAAHAVTQEELEAGLERAIDKMTAIMREEFAKRDVEIAVIKEQLEQLVTQRREDREFFETQRREDREYLEAQRREDREFFETQHRDDRESFETQRREDLERLDQERREDLVRLDQERREALERLDQQRREDLRRLELQRQEDLERERANRRERRAVYLALGGALIAMLLRIFGAI